MYALATVPLIKSLPTSVNQVWYADDAAATGKIADLREWWDEISRLGPSYGYYANGSKTWLVVKKEFQSMATTIFGSTQVNITSEGRPHLGAPVGSSEYVSKFVAKFWLIKYQQKLKYSEKDAHRLPQMPTT